MKRSPFVEFFDSGRPDAARIGGKGASLCRLTGHGHRVPPGFVITVDAFVHACEALGLGEAAKILDRSLAGSGDIARLGGQASTALAASRIPKTVLAPIEAAVRRVGLWRDNTQGVIVRSSATVEDGAAHSFAGIFESIPITTPDQLEPTIREVWSSVFSPRALTYFREVGLTQVPTMAVVVQRFLHAERSGVMFTSFSGRTLVEHVEGDCEKLVKGEVTPEQLWIDGPGRDPGASGLLKPAHARELSRLAATLEAEFGGPQDVEWVVWENEVHVVQSRPITTPAAQASGSTTVDLSGLEPILTGTPASGGFGAGAVHLVHNIEQALAILKGQVLVTPMTNPDMVVAMRQSAAIVTDVGGMICHAAIVSRELGLPCVVGTAKATTILRQGDLVTVAGTAGKVFRGKLEIVQAAPARPCEWADLWAIWTESTTGKADVPLVSSVDALTAMPAGFPTVVIAPDIDLRCGPTGLWVDLEGMSAHEADAVLADYVARLSRVARERSLQRLIVRPGAGLPRSRLADAVRRAGPPLAFADDSAAPRAIALGSAAADAAAAPAVSGMPEAEAAALDTIKFFGHQPGSSIGPMPDPERRVGWWTLLPEYGRFHREAGTPAERGEHTWLEVRPELVISALLKSLVQPGFEMVPRVMGFRDLPPMHIKWIKCRYNFRSDTFAGVWRALVRATWDGGYMADLMRRVRRSYQQLGEVLLLFPTTDAELAAVSPERMVALITSWWPRWVEFFALCWFIQAQGDDIIYPFLEETVRDNVRRLAGRTTAFVWPGAPDLVAPTTPVMSGEYMASVARVREALVAAGLMTRDAALDALERKEHPEVAARVAEHLKNWHWMRDRDLLFEPWDTPARVIETALRTEPHSGANYEANLRRNRLALSVHGDLAQAAGRADGLHHAARFLHDLNVERENHHVLWLKYSYPLRRLFVEVERRLVAAGSLTQGDIFFMQAPELIEAAGRLPAPLAPDLVTTIRNRRKAFRHEARLVRVGEAELVREDDYY